MLILIAVAVGVAYPPFLAAMQELQTGGAGVGFEFGAIAVQTAVMLWAVRDATVRTQKRPFLTLISPDRHIQPRRIVAGLVAWAIAAAIAIPFFTFRAYNKNFKTIICREFFKILIIFVKKQKARGKVLNSF